MMTTYILRRAAVATAAALTFLVCGSTVWAAAGDGTVLRPHLPPRARHRTLVHSAALPHGSLRRGHATHPRPYALRMTHVSPLRQPSRPLSSAWMSPRRATAALPPLTPSPTPTAVELEALRNRVVQLLFTPLTGSHDSLVRQNQRATQDGLARIEDDSDIRRQVVTRQLVPLPADQSIRTDERLAPNRRYTRPWTARFLLDLARAHYQRFGTSLQVNSAVRTVEFQKRLLRTNGNAAPASGDDSSSHLMGGTVDIAKKPMTPTEMAWMRGFLMPLQLAGLIDVEEEFQQACFHVAVYKAYAPHPPALTPRQLQSQSQQSQSQAAHSLQAQVNTLRIHAAPPSSRGPRSPGPRSSGRRTLRWPRPGSIIPPPPAPSLFQKTQRRARISP